MASSLLEGWEEEEASTSSLLEGWENEAETERREAAPKEKTLSESLMDYGKQAMALGGEALSGLGRGAAGTLELASAMTGHGKSTDRFIEDARKVQAERDGVEYAPTPPRDSLSNMLGIPKRGEIAGDGTASRIAGLAGEFSVPMGAPAKGAKYVKKGVETLAAATGAALTGQGLEKAFGENGRLVGEFVGSFLPWSAPKLANKMRNSEVKKVLMEVTPDSQTMSDLRNKLYKDIDELGGVFSQNQVDELVEKIEMLGFDNAMTKVAHPKSQEIFNVINDYKSAARKSNLDDNVKHSLTLKGLEAWRKTASTVARESIQTPADGHLASQILDELDSFLVAKSPVSMKTGKAIEGVADKLKDARELARRSILTRQVDQAMYKSTNQATGIENGLRIQFRHLLNKPAFKKVLKKDEIEAMERVVQGDTLDNISRQLGKLGVSADQTTNTISALAAGSVGYGVGGPLGAVAVTGLGTFSRKAAENMTKNNAELAKAILLAGEDSASIVRGYLKTVPKSKRNYVELAEILAQPNRQRLDKVKISFKDYQIAEKSLIENAMYLVPWMKARVDEAQSMQEQE